MLGADNPEAKGIGFCVEEGTRLNPSRNWRLECDWIRVELLWREQRNGWQRAEEAVTKALSLKSTMKAELEQGLAPIASLYERRQPSTTIPDPMELPDDVVSRLRARA